MYRNKPIIVGLSALAAGLALSGAVQAQPPAGRLLAAQCAQCHGTNGAGPGFDEIAGETSKELYSELLEMKNGNQIEGIMDRQAHGYTNEQLQLIADYLASQPGGGNAQNGDND
jgi:cytochrome subunit of sulfide dehydrogenase